MSVPVFRRVRLPEFTEREHGVEKVTVSDDRLNRTETCDIPSPHLVVPERLESPSAASSAPGMNVLGSTAPRIFTPPLRELTPETSYGFRVVEFAKRIGRPLDPWQEWLVIHAGELLPDGNPRFRTVVVLVSRQNGKTELLCILTLFWLFEERQKLVLGTSTNISVAMEPWEHAVELAQDCDELAERIAKVRRQTIDISLTTVDGCRYKIAASNRRGGRGLTINRLVADEFREHDKWDAYNAAIPAMSAVADAQAFMISNQGDDRAVVLDSLRKDAIKFIDSSGQDGDDDLGLFEWSAHDGADPTDVPELALANPNLNRRVPLKPLLAEARRAKEAGGEQLAGFKTERMCQRVHIFNPAVDPLKWMDCCDPLSMDHLRDRIALCVEVNRDQRHATLVAAAVEADKRVRVEVVRQWFGEHATKKMREELPGLVARVKPQVFGWIPVGPSAVVAAELKESREWPPRGVDLVEIRSEVTAICMGLADLVTAGQLAHSDDQVLNAHVGACEKKYVGDAWVFGRKNASGPIDAAYAMAGAVHLARTLPPPRSPLTCL